MRDIDYPTECMTRLAIMSTVLVVMVVVETFVLGALKNSPAETTSMIVAIQLWGLFILTAVIWGASKLVKWRPASLWSDAWRLDSNGPFLRGLMLGSAYCALGSLFFCIGIGYSEKITAQVVIMEFLLVTICAYLVAMWRLCFMPVEKPASWSPRRRS